MAHYRIKEAEQEHGDLILEKSVTDEHGQQSWKEDLRMPDTTTEREDIDELEDWKTEQETVIPDGVIKGIKELENFLSSISDDTTLAEILHTLTESLSGMILAKYTKPGDGIPATDLSEAVNLILTKASAAYTTEQIGKLAVILSLSTLSDAGTTISTTNPEWKFVLTDNEDRILLGIKQDYTWHIYADLDDILDTVVNSIATAQQ